MPRINSAAYALLIALALAPVAGAGQDAGRSIYRAGVLADGGSLRGEGGGGQQLTGATAACVRCHRRSGFGSAEGEIVVPAIAGPWLFGGKVPVGVPREHGYTRAEFANLLRTGVDPSGRTLSPIMPRYEIGDDDVAQLAAYLERLSTGEAEGIVDGVVHFASIVAPDSAPGDQDAFSAVMQSCVTLWNRQTRGEEKRRDARPGRMKQHYLYYRPWSHSVWTLSGEPDTWREQLEERYREHPVYAVMSGIGTHWEPVEQFCEARGLPCLMPMTEPPRSETTPWYSLYLRRTADLESGIVATHLAGLPATEPIAMMVHSDKDGGRSDALRAVFKSSGRPAVPTLELSLGDDLEDEMTRFLARKRPRHLVAWLDDAGLSALRAVLSKDATGIDEVYLAEDSAWRVTPEAWPTTVRLRFASAHPVPTGRDKSFMRERAWFVHSGVPFDRPLLQAQSLFACTTVMEAMGHSLVLSSRDYLMERIEHMGDSLRTNTVYPRVTLGPDQRLMVKSARILERVPGTAAPARAITDWLTVR